jgi:hypothetical protein
MGVILEHRFQAGPNIFRRFQVVFGILRDRLCFDHAVLLQGPRELRRDTDILNPSPFVGPVRNTIAVSDEIASISRVGSLLSEG